MLDETWLTNSKRIVLIKLKFVLALPVKHVMVFVLIVMAVIWREASGQYW